MKSIKKTLGIVLTAAAVVTAGSIFVSVAGNHLPQRRTGNRTVCRRDGQGRSFGHGQGQLQHAGTV